MRFLRSHRGAEVRLSIEEQHRGNALWTNERKSAHVELAEMNSEDRREQSATGGPSEGRGQLDALGSRSGSYAVTAGPAS